MKGGRRDAQERNRQKCEGQQDPISFDPIVDDHFAIRLLENGHYFCFDIRTLHQWFSTGSRINPPTGLRFSEANIQKINRKFGKVGLPLLNANQALRQGDRDLINRYRNTCAVSLQLAPAGNELFNSWYLTGNPRFHFDVEDDLAYVLFFTPEIRLEQGITPDYFLIVPRTVETLRRLRAQLNTMNLHGAEQIVQDDTLYEWW
jgi:hypothetical protein